MEIQLESAEPHTIRSYSDQHIRIGETTLHQSCVICKTSILADWPVHTANQLTLDDIEPLLITSPDIILIGHAGPSTVLPELASALSLRRIGLECMSIGSACRTFNILLGEQRAVVLGIVLAGTSCKNSPVFASN